MMNIVLKHSHLFVKRKIILQATILKDNLPIIVFGIKKMFKFFEVIINTERSVFEKYAAFSVKFKLLN